MNSIGNEISELALPEGQGVLSENGRVCKKY